MPGHSHTHLRPAQQWAFDSPTAGIQLGSILRVWSGVGRGKTPVPRALHEQAGGAFVNIDGFVAASAKARGADLKPTGDYFMRAVEVVKENKQRYETAQAQALMQPESPMTGFMRLIVTSRVFKAGARTSESDH